MNFTEQYFIDSQKIIMGVIQAAKPELLAHFGKVKSEFKADNSVVTEMDKSLELKLKDALRDHDPSVGFLGEEYGQEGSSKSYWLIDPIDGTESYIRGRQGCRCILTFVDNNEAQYALAYRFMTDDLYTAVSGKGTYKNDAKVSVSQRPLSRSWLEFSVNMLQPEGYRIYQNLRPKIAGITVHEDFLVATEGVIEGLVVYKSGGEVWDYAPRALLIKEAGGRVANIGSDKYDIYNFNLVAASPVIFDEIMTTLSGIS